MRARIVVLALIPVVGFLANGITYVSGEGEVATAFETVRARATQLADASREFKIAIAAMRIAAKDFTVAPHGRWSTPSPHRRATPSRTSR